MKDLRLTLVAICSILTGMVSTAGHADIVGSVPGAGPALTVRKNAVTAALLRDDELHREPGQLRRTGPDAATPEAGAG